jgi:hypothetical protein
MNKVDKVIRDVRKRGLFTSRGYRLGYNYSIMNNDDIKRSIDKIKFLITIDNVNLTVYVEKKYFHHERGYLGYYRYIWDGVKHNFYLSNDDVFDGKPFFTTDNTERRKSKIENIKKRLRTK